MQIRTEKSFEQIRDELMNTILKSAEMSLTNRRSPTAVYIDEEGIIDYFHIVHGAQLGDKEFFVVFDTEGGVNFGDNWYTETEDTDGDTSYHLAITVSDLLETGWFDEDLSKIEQMMTGKEISVDGEY